jgi:hypothetical protein
MAMCLTCTTGPASNQFYTAGPAVIVCCPLGSHINWLSYILEAAQVFRLAVLCTLISYILASLLGYSRTAAPRSMFDAGILEKRTDQPTILSAYMRPGRTKYGACSHTRHNISLGDFTLLYDVLPALALPPPSFGK